MKFIKKYYLLLLLIITLTGISIYGTYAMFTSEIGVDAIKLEASNIPVDQEIIEYEKIVISANDSKTIALNVSNSTNQTLHYGAWYQMVSPDTINDNIRIAKLTDSPDETSGTIDGNSNKTIYIYIGNNSSSTITLYVGIKYSETSSLNLPDNRTLITDVKDGKFIINVLVTNGIVDSASKKLNKGNSVIFKISSNNNTEIESIKCINGVANYNESTGTLAINNITGDVNCNVKFKEPITVAELVEEMKNNSNTGTPNFSQIATTDEGIYAAPDDYGTSYYYRGAVENNYVKFAGFYWRIIRANGDGSIRLIYDGTVAHVNGKYSTDRQIGISPFNNSGNYDNAYVGYMYGNVGSSTYEATHANINNSSVKIVVDNWYKTNIADKGYGNYIADIIYCNDRSLYSGSGYSRKATNYGAYNRLDKNKSPILTCSQKNDAFTVNDTSKGNGALTYPIGLITADEVSMAGGVGGTGTEIWNTHYYLYTGYDYWTMSPRNVFSSTPHLFNVSGGGYIGYFPVNYTGVNSYIRPVISLKPDTRLIGNGTITSPFEVL